jgi:tetratricopeptide (TPR) repeat protein
MQPLRQDHGDWLGYEMKWLIRANRARLLAESKLAKAEFEEFLKSSSHPRVLWLLASICGLCYSIGKEPDLRRQARDYLDEALVLDPNEPMFYVTRGEFYWTGIAETIDYEKSAENYRKAATLCPTLASAWRGINVVFNSEDWIVNLEEAVQAMESAIRAWPDSGFEIRVLGSQYYNQGGDQLKGLRLYRQALLCPEPLHPDELTEIEQSLRGYQPVAGNIRWTLPELDPEMTVLFRANQARREGRYLDAAHDYAQLLREEGDDAYVARMFALSYFRAAVQRADSSEFAALLEESHRWIDRAITLEPAVAVLHVTRGDIYRHELEPTDAQVAATSYRTAQGLDPNLAQAAIGLSHLITAPGSGVTLDEVLPLLQNTAREQPDEPLVWLNLGTLNYVAGDREQARSAYARSLLCSRPLLLEHVGVIEQRFGEDVIRDSSD